MALARRSRFVYATASAFAATLPARPWTPVDNTVGGSRTAASGVPASYIVRRDGLLELTLRIEEAEWAAFLALIVFGQSAAAFVWFPDAEEATSFTVYLDSPAAGEKWKPTRDTYARVFEVTITLRSTDGTPLWLPYFDD